MRRKLIRFPAVILLATTGCTTVQPVTAPVPFISARHPGVVYVLDKGGRQINIVSPALRGDSVVGASVDLDRPIGLPISAIDKVSASQVSKGRTIAFLGLVGVGTGLLIEAVNGAGTAQPCDPATYDPKFQNQGNAAFCPK